MKVLNFLKNAWKFRNELSVFKSTDARYALNFFKKGVAMFVEEHSDEIPDETLSCLKAFIETADKVVKDEFLMKACKEVLDTDFDQDEFDKGKLDYLMSLPQEDRYKIFKIAESNQKLAMIAFTSIIDSKFGIKDWFTTPTEK